MKKLFLSYSSKDRALALALKSQFELLGHQVWFDQEKIAGGEHYAARIPKGLNEAEIALILCTCHSMGDSRSHLAGSTEVIKEIELAQQLGCKVIPLKADNTPPAAFDDAYKYHMSTLQWIDICVAAELKDFTAVAQRILDFSAGITAEPDDCQYLKQAISYLKVNDWSKATKILTHHPFASDYTDEVDYLKLIAKLQKIPIKRMTKAQADAISTPLLNLLKGEIAAAAAYTLAILSRYFYQENCIADTTHGYDKLKAYSKSLGRLKVKYKKINEPLLPAENRFAIDWEF